MNRFRLLLLPALWAGLALAPTAWATGEAAPIELVAPRAGATLVAGAEADLEWAPRAPFARLAGIEEWEAFLSVDGGATYPVRITPHLSRDLRHVRWQVPGIPTADARLLLRLGDERRELSLELPQRFSIAASPGMERVLALASVAPAAGEPALPGHPGVVAWVEGTRRGGALRQMVAPERASLRPGFTLPESSSEAVELTSEEAPVQPPSRAARAAAGAPPAGPGSPFARPAPGPALASDILLLTRRRNE